MQGRLYVVGMGPGDMRYMTGEARDAIGDAELIAGYSLYVNILCEQYSNPSKEYYSTGMKDEVRRCRYALEQAAEGKKVALICSGDAGVYGMASLVLSLGEERELVPLGAGFDFEKRGYNRAQVDEHLERLDADIKMLMSLD